MKILDTLNLICDVGGMYDLATHRFDHHQRSFDTCWEPGEFHDIKLSSAGLIYKHFGKEIIKNATKEIWN